MKSKHALIIFMKAPRPGTVKTRMQPQLTPEQSLKLYTAMVEDLANRFRNSKKYDLHIYFWPPDGEAEIRQWLGDDLVYTQQRGADLGEKMHLAFCDTFDSGYHKTVIIGSDLPSLNDDHIQAAFRKLDDHDAVFGPTDDGGYYLIALKKGQLELFENVEWSTADVLSQSLKNAEDNHLKAGQLHQEADIDTFAEVKQLWQAINGSAGNHNLDKTAAALAEIFK